MAALEVQKPSQNPRGAAWSYIVPLERPRRPRRASDLCLRGRDLPAPLPVLACHPSNRRAAAAKAHQASLCRLARCPTRRTVKSTRAVHRSLAHLLPQGCCCAVAPQRTVCQATAAAEAPAHDRSQHAPLPRPLDPRPSTPLARRQRRRGHRRGLARRHDEASVAAPRQDREVRGVRRVFADAARPGAYIIPTPDHEKFLGPRGLCIP